MNTPTSLSVNKNSTTKLYMWVKYLWGPVVGALRLQLVTAEWPPRTSNFLLAEQSFRPHIALCICKAPFCVLMAGGRRIESRGNEDSPTSAQ